MAAAALGLTPTEIKMLLSSFRICYVCEKKIEDEAFLFPCGCVRHNSLECTLKSPFVSHSASNCNPNSQQKQLGSFLLRNSNDGKARDVVDRFVEKNCHNFAQLRLDKHKMTSLNEQHMVKMKEMLDRTSQRLDECSIELLNCRKEKEEAVKLYNETADKAVMLMSKVQQLEKERTDAELVADQKSIQLVSIDKEINQLKNRFKQMQTRDTAETQAASKTCVEKSADMLRVANEWKEFSQLFDKIHKSLDHLLHNSITARDATNLVANFENGRKLSKVFEEVRDQFASNTDNCNQKMRAVLLEVEAPPLSSSTANVCGGHKDYLLLD